MRAFLSLAIMAGISAVIAIMVAHQYADTTGGLLRDVNARIEAAK